MAPQSTTTNGPAARALRRWIASASASLPVPVSPSISTVTSDAARGRRARTGAASRSIAPTAGRSARNRPAAARRIRPAARSAPACARAPASRRAARNASRTSTPSMRLPFVDARSRSSGPFAVIRIAQWLRDTVGSVRRSCAPSAPPIRISSCSSVTVVPLSGPLSTLRRTLGQARVRGPASVRVAASGGRFASLIEVHPCRAQVDDQRRVLLRFDLHVDLLAPQLRILDCHRCASGPDREMEDRRRPRQLAVDVDRRPRARVDGERPHRGPGPAVRRGAMSVVGAGGRRVALGVFGRRCPRRRGAGAARRRGSRRRRDVRRTAAASHDDRSRPPPSRRSRSP